MIVSSSCIRHVANHGRNRCSADDNDDAYVYIIDSIERRVAVFPANLIFLLQSGASWLLTEDSARDCWLNARHTLLLNILVKNNVAIKGVASQNYARDTDTDEDYEGSGVRKGVPSILGLGLGMGSAPP